MDSGVSTWLFVWAGVEYKWEWAPYVTTPLVGVAKEELGADGQIVHQNIRLVKTTYTPSGEVWYHLAYERGVIHDPQWREFNISTRKDIEMNPDRADRLLELAGGMSGGARNTQVSCDAGVYDAFLDDFGIALLNGGDGYNSNHIEPWLPY